MKEAVVTGTNHNAILENRKNLLLTGVTDVESFDERTVSLYTQLGELTVQGRQLHVNGMNLETGEVTIEGDVWALCYGERDKRGPLSLLGKLFR
ncbi:sporulation protein YabP [Ruminococcus champanellensis]|uniref:sporulation protein YabP n=1 Tax=Ruminococcus champanellensis TaxID=1161942 RepID=UPI0026DDCBB8|nr:sporulation protein YabP [Ruminococcus champanellensis]